VLRWQVGNDVGGRLTVSLMGVLDENADLRPLGQLSGMVAIDLSGVRRISSTGVREWIELMRVLDGKAHVTLVACSPPTVTQLNLISNFRGTAEVESFIAPYECARCGSEREVLLDASAASHGGPHVPSLSCACGEPMELSELPERYLTFLADQRAGRIARN
jgi:hypothetical protein